jgi:hypothetical protein
VRYDACNAAEARFNLYGNAMDEQTFPLDSGLNMQHAAAQA